jgi:Type IV secretory pathway, VirB10 components
MAALMQQGTPPADPNGQAQKQNFLRGADGGSSLTPQGYSRNIPIPQQFPYELKAGTIIPGILLSGINSDLPGNVLAQVSENIWDTSSGKYVLIPKGTKIFRRVRQPGAFWTEADSPRLESTSFSQRNDAGYRRESGC